MYWIRTGLSVTNPVPNSALDDDRSLSVLTVKTLLVVLSPQEKDDPTSRPPYTPDGLSARNLLRRDSYLGDIFFDHDSLSPSDPELLPLIPGPSRCSLRILLKGLRI